MQASALATQRSGGRKDSNVHSIYDDQYSSDEEEEKMDRADNQRNEQNGDKGLTAAEANTEFEVVITRKAGYELFYACADTMQRVIVCCVLLYDMMQGWFGPGA